MVQAFPGGILSIRPRAANESVRLRDMRIMPVPAFGGPKLQWENTLWPPDSCQHSAHVPHGSTISRPTCPHAYLSGGNKTPDRRWVSIPLKGSAAHLSSVLVTDHVAITIVRQPYGRDFFSLPTSSFYILDDQVSDPILSQKYFTLFGENYENILQGLDLTEARLAPQSALAGKLREYFTLSGGNRP